MYKYKVSDYLFQPEDDENMYRRDVYQFWKENEINFEYTKYNLYFLKIIITYFYWWTKKTSSSSKLYTYLLQNWNRKPFPWYYVSSSSSFLHSCWSCLDDIHFHLIRILNVSWFVTVDFIYGCGWLGLLSDPSIEGKRINYDFFVFFIENAFKFFFK